MTRDLTVVSDFPPAHSVKHPPELAITLRLHISPRDLDFFLIIHLKEQDFGREQIRIHRRAS